MTYHDIARDRHRGPHGGAHRGRFAPISGSDAAPGRPYRLRTSRGSGAGARGRIRLHLVKPNDPMNLATLL